MATAAIVQNARGCIVGFPDFEMELERGGGDKVAWSGLNGK